MKAEDDLRQFEAWVEQTLSSQVALMDCEMHPPLDQLMMATLPEDPAAESVRAHLVLCSACANRLRTMERIFKRQAEAIQPVYAASRVRAAQRLGLEAATARRTSPRMWLKRLKWLSPGRAFTLATATALAVCLAVLLPPAIAHWGAHEPSGTGSVGSFIPRDLVDSAWYDVTPEQLLAEMEAVDRPVGAADAALLIGLLSSLGFPYFSEEVAFLDVKNHTVGMGDTWMSLAEAELGDARMWPLILLLNQALASDGQIPPPGTELTVPVPLER